MQQRGRKREKNKKRGVPLASKYLNKCMSAENKGIKTIKRDIPHKFARVI